MNRLLFKFSAIILGILLIVGTAYVKISSYTNGEYQAEMSQRLNGGIAEYTVKQMEGSHAVMDTSMIKDIIKSLMDINPSVEVYLLNAKGDILAYDAPKGRVMLDRVDLAPVKQFVAAEPKSRPFIRGDDPRHPDEPNIFSAAEILDESGNLDCYVYIILSGDEQASVAAMLNSNYNFKLGRNLFFLSLLAAFLMSLLAIRYLTRNLRHIENTVHRFQEGDYAARVDTDQGGEFAFVAATFNEMADRINANIDELKSVDGLRRELVANISHDLRTPLAIVQGFVETLIMKSDTMPLEERKRHLNTIMKGTERLNVLISQLFEYSKLEASQVQLDKESFCVCELAFDVARKYSVLAKSQGIKIKVDQPEDLPFVTADLGLIERVMQNLIDNALKFTPEGGAINIDFSVFPHSVQVSVTDTGPGIPEDELPFIFDRYSQGSRAGNGENAGAGLGLAIVKKILDLHGQEVGIKSRLNEGTSFIFELPRT
ncbi:HAMP domain-containing histidine kinase [Neolewinella aurantiaca]|uniref:histidine kinase n=1 Tax=Neolewinella aurantiaca TaxID=2602767 RepID=A0A5C7FKY5_9BACT|nr:HAMP domain-containing sensor histidine kinase [Neolewinella aurantiaca]TXF88035.1 HAMP domain-containing histidine kinase [Neolewinella aurantiaca]